MIYIILKPFSGLKPGPGPGWPTVTACLDTVTVFQRLKKVLFTSASDAPPYAIFLLFNSLVSALSASDATPYAPSGATLACGCRPQVPQWQRRLLPNGYQPYNVKLCYRRNSCILKHMLMRQRHIARCIIALHVLHKKT